jgi:hypothetical protein
MLLLWGCGTKWEILWEEEDGDGGEADDVCTDFTIEEETALGSCIDGETDQVVVEQWTSRCIYVRVVFLQERLGTVEPCNATASYGFETALYGDSADWLSVAKRSDGYWWAEVSIDQEAYDDYCRAGYDCTLEIFSELVDVFTYYQISVTGDTGGTGATE